MSRTAIATIATLLALAAPASAALDPITLLSGSSATSGGDDYTFAAEASDGSEAITPDGRYIAFATLATNVATGLPDTNTSSDIIWEDLQTGQVKLVSVNAAGTAAANAVSVRPAI